MQSQRMKFDIMKYSWKSTDLNLAATTWTTGVPIWGGETGYVIGIHGYVKTAFAGITGPLWVEIGDSTNTDSILPRRDLANTGDLHTSTPWYMSGEPICNYGLMTKYDMTAPVVTFTSNSGNLEDLTAGEFEVVMIHLIEDNS